MKNIMKKQCEKFPLWGCKGLLSVALSALVVNAFAQGVDVCANALPYTIASTVDASGASTYQWLENGQIISNASAATYVVPSGKAAGQYTYIRQAKSADCSEWQSSNEFVVTVFNCAFSAGSTTGAAATFTDPRDGKSYKTVVMPDGKTWFAQNLNYTKDLTYNAYAYEANGKQFTSTANGVPAIGSYWCPAVSGSVISGSEAECRTYGALYTWETAMMVDGKYADETKTSTAWNEDWVSPYYFSIGTAPATDNNSDRNNARGGTGVKGGGRGICPPGWHIPTDYEWANLLNEVEGSNTYTKQTGTGWWGHDAGQKLKSSATYSGTTDPGVGSWYLESTNNGTDDYGFTAVPSGYKMQIFLARALYSMFWTSSIENKENAWNRYVISYRKDVNRTVICRACGFSARCVKN
jgi:uncharacterized protein (TIGR02145 family)